MRPMLDHESSEKGRSAHCESENTLVPLNLLAQLREVVFGFCDAGLHLSMYGYPMAINAAFDIYAAIRTSRSRRHSPRLENV